MNEERTLLVTLEVDINSNLIKLDLNREKTMFENNTEYKALFVDEEKGYQAIAEALCNEFKYDIVSIKDSLCGNEMWEV